MTARPAVVRIVCNIHAVSVAVYQAGYTSRSDQTSRRFGATLTVYTGLAGLAGVHTAPAVPHVYCRVDTPAVAPDLRLRAGAGRCAGVWLAGWERDTGSHKRAGTVFLGTSGTDEKTKEQAECKEQEHFPGIVHEKELSEHDI